MPKTPYIIRPKTVRNDGIILLKAQTESSTVRETDDMMMEIDEHITKVEEDLEKLSKSVGDQNLKILAYSDADGNREDIADMINEGLEAI